MPSLANVQRYIAAGFSRLDFHQLDSNGLPAGATGAVVAGATGVPAARITGVKTMNLNIPAADAVPVTGDNNILGTFVFPNAAARTFELDFAEDDFADRQAFQSIIPRNIGNLSFAGRDTSPLTLNNTMMIGISNAQAQAAGVKGLGMYEGVIIPRAQMIVRGRNGFVERQAAAFNGTVTMNPSDGYPWGETFQTAIQGYTSSFVEDFTHAYPVTLHRWTQTGAATVFNLGETPASTSLSDVLVWVIDSNGIPTRQTSGVTINATNKTLTFSIAPAASSSIIAFYGYVPS